MRKPSRVRWALNHARNALYKVRYPWLEHGEDFHCQWSTLFRNPNRFARFGDRCGVGNRCFVLADLETGDDVLIASYVAFVNKSDHLYDQVGKTIKASGTGPRQRITVESDVWIGHGATLVAPLHIGRGSIIAAGSVVVKDVPRYSIVGGLPAQVLKMRFTPEEIREHEDTLVRKGQMTQAERTET